MNCNMTSLKYMNVENGQDWSDSTDTIFDSLFAIDIYNSVVWSH